MILFGLISVLGYRVLVVALEAACIPHSTIPCSVGKVDRVVTTLWHLLVRVTIR
jgi:hypothetical protein